MIFISYAALTQDKRTTRITLTKLENKETDRLIESTNCQIEEKNVGLTSDECKKIMCCAGNDKFNFKKRGKLI